MWALLVTPLDWLSLCRCVRTWTWRETQSMRTRASPKSDNDVSILSDIYHQNLFSPSVAGLLHMQVAYLQ